MRGDNILKRGGEINETKNNKKRKFAIEWHSNSSNSSSYKIENNEKRVEYLSKKN